MKRWIRQLFATSTNSITRLGLTPLEDRTVPATFVVTSTADSGSGSLRQAIGLANSTEGADTITFQSGLGEIVLTSNELVLTDTTGKTTITGPSTGTQVIARSSATETAKFRIFRIDSESSVEMKGLTIRNGTAVNGGGVYNSGTLTLSNTTISGNLVIDGPVAGSSGGGLFNTGTAIVTNSTIAGNTSIVAGGISNLGGATLTVINSTISGNSADAVGGIRNYGAATFINTTITGNSSKNSGGLATRTGTTTLTNTIVAGNLNLTTPDDINGELAAASKNNLIGVDTNLTGITNGSQGNQIGTATTPLDAKLGTLALNGGSTKTHALLPGSPALNLGDNTGVSTMDQRGFARVVGATVDIGAVEAQAVAITPSKIATSTAGKPYNLSLLASFPNQPAGTTFTFTTTDALPSGITLSPGGVISGTATVAGNTVFAVTAKASTGDFSPPTNYTLTVNPSTSRLVVVDDSANTTIGKAVILSVLANDSSLDGKTLTVTSTTIPAKGSVLVNTNQTITYSPIEDFVGNDTFTYTISDGVASATATVTVNVAATTPIPDRTLLVGSKEFAVGQDVGGSNVNFYNPNGSLRFTVTPFAGFTGGLRTASADFNRDGVADVVIGTGPGRSTRVVVLDGKNQSTLFTVDPFEETFKGGVFVSVGDVTGDGFPDLAVTPDEGGGPRVDVYSGSPGFPKLSAFLGIDDSVFRGGARSSIADMNGDGFGDLMVVAGFGGGPRVAGFDGKSLGGTPRRLFGDFFAFEQTLRNGVFVTAGDLNADGKADLIAGGGPGGGPRVLALDGANLINNQLTTLANFFSGDVNSRGGIRVAVKDLDGDNRADLLVGSGTKAGSKATTFLGKNITANGTPATNLDFDAFAGFTGGIFVG
ncbi:MAG: choice-of-anchor Q domain-containing protein [Fimbriiglobus sp.]